MSVELNWQEGEETGDVRWEQLETTVAQEPARTIVNRTARRPVRSRRVVQFLLAVLAGMLIGGAGLAVFVAVRSNEGSELARRDVEASVALLLDAQRSGDIRGYAQMLDGTAEIWRSRQIAELRQGPPAPAHASVQSVQLQGDLAMANLLETPADGGESTSRTAFFRLRNGQWLLTAPDPEQFGPVAELVTSHFQISYREADKSTIQALVDLSEGFYVALCGELRCRESERPIPLVLDYADTLPTAGDGLQVRSSQLSGLTSTNRPGPAFEQELAAEMASYLAAAGFPAASPALRTAAATWAASDLTGITAADTQALRAAVRRGEDLSLEDAWQAITVRNRGNLQERAIVVSMFGYAQEIYGAGAAGRLLDAAPAELPLALRRSFDVSTGDFQAGWLTWMQAGSSDADLPA
ncbi:MAG TPA: hypothetical protein P5148_00740 [Anaerolineae bacterium]|nr:hypothetical protein [Anaerolineae bacterium]